jgi:PAS domain S-box-containing protein
MIRKEQNTGRTRSSDGASAATEPESKHAAERELRQARQSRDQSEAKYQALIEVSTEIVWVIDENGKVNDDSQTSWCKFTGQTEADWVGRRWTDCVHPHDRDRVAECWITLPPADTSCEYEYRLRHRSGDWRWMRERVVPLKGREGRLSGWIGMTRDISSAKAAMTEIAESESRYRALVQAASQVVWRTDPSGTIRRDSPTWRVFTGKSLAEYLDERWLTAIHPDDQQSALQSWREAIHSRGNRVVQYRLLRADGQWRWMLERSVPYDAGWVSMAIDITDAKVAEKRLADRERHLSLALKASSMAAWHVDASSGQLVIEDGQDVLPALAGSEDHFATMVGIVTTPSAIQLKEMMLAIREKAEPLEIEFEVLGQPQPCWLSMHGRSVPSADASQSRIFGVIRDITGRKLIEERRNLLIGEIAHRGKNLLSVVQAIAAITVNGEGDAIEASAKFQERLATLGRAHSLLSEKDWYGVPLDEIVRQELGKFTDQADIDVAAVILNPSAAQNCALVFHELTTNAVKYGALSVRSGRVAVRGCPDTHAGEPCIALEWKETGGPPVSFPKRRGFGTVLIRRLLSGFDTDGRLEYEPDGLRLQLDMPLSMIEPAPNVTAGSSKA